MFNNTLPSNNLFSTVHDRNNDSTCAVNQCYRSYFGINCSSTNLLHEWNQTVIDEFISEGCDCASLVEVNQITNWVCKPYAVKHPWWIQLIYFVMFGFIILASIGGNLTVIWVVLAHKRMRTVTNYFLVNLAIADASISLFNVCFSFTFNLYYDWFFGKTYCIFNNFMGVVPTCASVFTLMLMSLDRFVAIVYPLKRRLSQKKTIAAIICIWCAACLCGLPMLLYSHTMTFYFENGYENTVCLSDQYPDGTADTSVGFRAYNYILLSFTYLLPLAVLTATYTRMGVELWGSQSIGDYRHEANIKAKKKIVKMMIVVVTIFMTCWLPYHLYFTIFIRQFAHIDISTAVHIYLNMYWLAMSSTVANPIIYVWLNSKFRTGFKYVFRWLPCINMNDEQYTNSELNRDRFDSAAYVIMQRKATIRQSKNYDKTTYRNGAFNNLSTIETSATTNAAVRRGKRLRSVSSGTQLTSVEEEPFSQALCLLNNEPNVDCYLIAESDVVF